MLFLLTNDDGYDAPGLAALAEAADLFAPAATVAPASNWSVCAHRVTTDKPLRIEHHGEQRWAIDGTPADCVRLAMVKLAPAFDWCLSGLNHGGNLGADVYHSGTVAAVREAVLHGRRGIAFSHYRKRGMEIDWPRATNSMRRVLEELLPKPMELGTFWNVNLPSLTAGEPEPKIVLCPLDPEPLPVSFREEAGVFHYDGNYHGRPRRPGCDIDVCFQGNIAISLLRL
jgi:5'-nucleotidase